MSKPSRYTSDEDSEKIYGDMMPKPGGIGAGTLVRKAVDAGYSGPIGGKSGEQMFGHIRSVQSDTQSTKGNKFRLIFPRDMRDLPEPRYVVEPIIPACGISLFYGAPASFKSFVVMDLLASVAAGCDAFAKFHTDQGAAILCAGEAPFGIARKRWPAWAQARGIADPDGVAFAIVPAVPLASDVREVEELIASIKSTGLKPSIVAVDTVALAIGGLDENDARAAGLMLKAAHRIRDEFGCAVILVHHAGKDEGKGARGSSALAAGVDAMYRVSRDGDTWAVTLRCEKMKDADQPEDIHLLGNAGRGSLIFDWIAKDEHATLTRKNGGPTTADVGAVLTKLATPVTTHVLAIELAGPDATENEVGAMTRLLQREAKDRFRPYVVHHGTGGRDATMWGCPPATNRPAQA